MALSATALADRPSPGRSYRLRLHRDRDRGQARPSRTPTRLVLAEHETGEVAAVTNIALGQARLDVGTKLRARLELDGDTAVLTTTPRSRPSPTARMARPP